MTAKALSRLWGRDVMLYTGGVSFYALLAAFPTLAIVISVDSVLLTPERAIHQADALGASLEVGAGPEALQVGLTALPTRFQGMVDLLADVALRPNLDPGEWDKLKATMASHLQTLEKQNKMTNQLTANVKSLEETAKPLQVRAWV